MIYSEKKRDFLEARTLMLEAMKICLRTGNLGIAKDIGKSSAIIKKRIEQNNYGTTNRAD